MGFMAARPQRFGSSLVLRYYARNRLLGKCWYGLEISKDWDRDEFPASRARQFEAGLEESTDHWPPVDQVLQSGDQQASAPAARVRGRGETGRGCNRPPS